MSAQPRLLCIDLQTDDGRGITPDARAIFGARQLLAIARRCGWPVVHTRLRSNVVALAEPDAKAGGLRPLTSERVFLRNRRAITDCPGLMEQLEQWSRDTVYVATFDAIALISLLIDRIDRGPNFMLVEDAVSANLAITGRAALDPFCSAAYSLAPTTSIRALVDLLEQPPANVVQLDPRLTQH